MKNSMHKTIFILLLTLGITLPGASQEPQKDLVLNLQGAISYALEYNKSLKNSRMQVERSDASIKEAISQGLPQVDGAVDFMTYFNYEMEFSFGAGGAPDFSDEQLQTALDQTLAAFPGSTPNDIYMHQAGNYFDGVLSSMLPPSTILMSNQSTAKLQLSQLIFSGQYIAGIQTAKLAKKISEQNLDFDELTTKETVITSYYLVLITEESLDIVERNLVNLKETMRQTENMFNAGMAEQTDVDQISITVNQLQNSKTALERNVEINYNLLRFQLGLEPGVGVTLTDDLRTLFFTLQPETALTSPFILNENVTYQIMQTQEEINKKLVDLEQWNYAPTLLGFYNYNAKIQTTGFDMTPNHLAGLSLAVPIFSSGMRKARVNQAKIDYSMAQTNLSIMQDQLLLQEKQFKYNLQSSLDNLNLQKENVEVAQRVFDSYQRKFEQGMATSLDLTQANGNYLDAESNYIQAIMEVLNARLQLDKLMNNL